MLTQQQVNLAKKELKTRQSRIKRARKGDLTKIDQEIARIVGCSSSSICSIRKGNHKLKILSTTPEPTTCVCPNCGPIKAPFCVLCETKKMNGSRPRCPDPVNDGPEPGWPTPQEIFVRSAQIRAAYEINRNPVESYEETVEGQLWIDPEDFERPPKPIGR